MTLVFDLGKKRPRIKLSSPPFELGANGWIACS